MVNPNIKDSLMDLLMQEKDILKVYASFLPEGSCTELRTILQKNMDAITKEQFTVFEELKSRGWYQVKDAEAAAVNQAKQSFAPAS
jgi:Coat F domain.